MILDFDLEKMAEIAYGAYRKAKAAPAGWHDLTPFEQRAWIAAMKVVEMWIRYDLPRPRL